LKILRPAQTPDRFAARKGCEAAITLPDDHPARHLWRRATIAQLVPLGRGRTIPTKGKLFVLLTLTNRKFLKTRRKHKLLISKFQVRALVRQPRLSSTCNTTHLSTYRRARSFDQHHHS
jgi:hypothetical protein